MRRRTFLTGVSAAGIVTASGPPRPVLAQSRDVPPEFTLLRAVENRLVVDGKSAKVYDLVQPDGTRGYVGVKGGRFRVALDNGIPRPISIHWHGLLLPNGQDGVPYVTQAPLRPGERRWYDFPLTQAGTYWMHSHWGLHEQSMMDAPLILRDPSGPAHEHEVVMVLNDFTDRDPAAIVAGLEGRRGAAATSASSGTTPMRPVPGRGPAMSGMRTTGPDLNDVRYDAFLVNRRPLSDPEIVRGLPGRPVRVRIINAASGTNFTIDVGALDAEAIALDGENIAPVAGRTFEVAIAQRIDLRVVLPRRAGAFPILALGEGTAMRAGLVLATPGAPIPPIASTAPRTAGALTNALERRARPLRPLDPRPIDRALRVRLTGDMARYVWTLDDRAWPDIVPLVVKKGERIEIAFVNETGMAHPMHLHGHVFQVTEVDGLRRRGAMRDTVLVLPRQTVKVELDASYPGYWMLHCHLLYHQAAGMQTVLRYDGFQNPAYDPMKSLSEFTHR
jgi:FtsP/CotA-like multicopper oxidase with cupredoxin domain